MSSHVRRLQEQSVLVQDLAYAHGTVLFIIGIMRLQ